MSARQPALRLREHGYARATNLTIAQFAKRNYALTPTGGAVVKYGFFNRAGGVLINHQWRSTVRGDYQTCYERLISNTQARTSTSGS